MPQIRTKREMFRRLIAGEFGNHVGHWWTADEAIQACPDVNDFAIRCVVPSHSSFRRGIRRDELHAVVQQTCREHDLRSDDLVIARTAPDQYRTIQGEVMMGWDGRLCLQYTLRRIDLRTALKTASRHAYGAAALAILQSELAVEDSEHLQDLLDHWDGSVIEFTAFSRRLGTQHRKMVVWEARNF